MKSLISSFLIFLLIASCATPERNEQAVYLQTEEFAKFKYPFSEAVRYGNILYASGQVGNLPDTEQLIEGGIVAETNQTMENIKAVLERYGSSMDNIIKCTCMLADIEEWGLMSKEYVKYFPNHKPARSAFGTTGLALGARVEIECMAYIDSDKK